MKTPWERLPKHVQLAILYAGWDKPVEAKVMLLRACDLDLEKVREWSDDEPALDAILQEPDLQARLSPPPA